MLLQNQNLRTNILKAGIQAQTETMQSITIRIYLLCQHNFLLVHIFQLARVTKNINLFTSGFLFYLLLLDYCYMLCSVYHSFIFHKQNVWWSFKDLQLQCLSNVITLDLFFFTHSPLYDWLRLLIFQKLVHASSWLWHPLFANLIYLHSVIYSRI